MLLPPHLHFQFLLLEPDEGIACLLVLALLHLAQGQVGTQVQEILSNLGRDSFIIHFKFVLTNLLLSGGRQHAKKDEVSHLILVLLASKATSTIFTNRTSLVPPIIAQA